MFLNPWLLLGALGIGVPIVIHLLNQRRFQRVVWAAMRFVQVSLEKNRQRMMIENLLLLILRCVILALLAVALARPVLSGRAAILGRQPVTAVILLDQSGSMGKSDGTRTRFEGAKRAADEIVAGLPSGSSVAVLLASDTVRDLIPQPTVDLGLVRQNIARAGVTDRGSDMSPGLKRAFAILDSVRAANKQLFVLTDGQASGWRQAEGVGIAPDIAQILEAHREQAVTQLCLISDHDTRNLLVSGLRLTTELPTVDKPLRIEVDVRNTGPAEVRDVPVRLFGDAAATAVDEAVIPSLPAGSTQSVSLGIRVGSDGYHVITARIPHDSLPADDERSVVTRILGEVRVLLVNGDAGRQAQEEDVFFVRNALQPVAPEQRSSYFIQTETMEAQELDHASLEKYDVIVLANVAELSQSTMATLERVVSQGRGLLVFSGPRVNLDFYRDVLYRQHGLLPAWLGDAHGDAQGEHFEALQSGGFDHPITSIWNQKSQGDAASARLFRMNDLFADARPASGPATDSPPGPTATVARYASGKAAIAEHSYGQGRVLLVGTTANTLWTDLPARGTLFVPLMHRVVDRLLHRQEESLNVGVGQRVKLRFPSTLWGKEVTIGRHGDASGLPAMTRIEMIDNWPTLMFDGTDRSGVYDLGIEGGPAGEPGYLAVQPNAGESNLEELSAREVERLGSLATVVAGEEAGAVKKLQEQRSGVELWRPLIVFVLLMIVTETVLAFRFSRVK